MSKDPYAVYVTNKDTIFSQLSLSAQEESSGKRASSDDHHLMHLGGVPPVSTQHNTYAAIGEGVTEIDMDAEPPLANRFTIGYPTIRIGIITEDDLNVYYKKEGSIFVATYHKHGTNWEFIDEYLASDQQDHSVNSRSEIICGAFVTASSNRHYFCFIERIQSSVKCALVEDYLQSKFDNILEYDLPQASVPSEISLLVKGSDLIIQKCQMDVKVINLPPG